MLKKKNLKRWISSLTVAGMMFSMLTPMASAVDNGLQVSAVDYSKVPKLLITELVPDTANLSGSDAYEFIEVYNNTNRAIDFKDYNMVYRASGADTVWEPYNNGNPGGSMVIPSQSSIVLWVMNSVNKALTETNFNTNFASNLHENVNLFRVEGGGGMHNSSPRDLVIQEKSGGDISVASYQNDNQTKPDKGIFYKYPVDGTKNMIMYGSGEDAIPAAATPGVVDVIQVPPVPLNFSEPPVIAHTPVTQADQRNDLLLQARITNTEQDETVTAAVYYQTGAQAAYDSVPMTVTGSHQYQAAVPKGKLVDSQLKYYIQADDGHNTVRSNVYQVAIALDQTDYTKIPPLLVTEVVPDSTNVGSSDGYEFIEVYNNTDQAVNFKDYKLVYRYTDSGPSADVLWPADKEDMIIPSKGTLVFWIINSQNMNSTAAEFNANYNTHLVEGTNLVRIHSDGMANSANRGILIATNAGAEISSAYYIAGDAKPNKGVFYKYPLDGTSTMVKYSSAVAAATPGTVDQIQVPEQTVKVKPDLIKPVLTDLTNKTIIEQSQDLEIIGDAKDETQVKTMALYYKTEKQASYLKRYLKESFADTMYHYTVYSPELIGNAYLDYYFVASDGTNESTSSTKRIAIQGGSDHSSLRLNVKDGDIVTQTKVIKGTGEGLGADDLKLAMDGNELTQATFHAAEHDAYFAFDVTGVNYYFKNGVTQGQEILSIFQDPIDTFTTLSIPFTADRLKPGSNVISIRAGSKASPFDDRVEENKDDFEVKNVRLVFDDGTIIYDVKYNDPAKVIKMGDSVGKNPVVDFEFLIPDSQLASRAYVWNTALMTDGPHAIAVSHAIAGTATATVTVDNTAPVVQPSIEEGVIYRGAFNLDAVISDALAGVDKVEAMLDEQVISQPYATSSAQLPGGAHAFTIKATDKVGNATNVKVNFTVPNEMPNMPEQITPGQQATGVDRNAPLRVKVTDPMNDEMSVSFNQGFKYDASTQGQFSGYRNASDTEPPKQEKPDGETPFTQEDYALISSIDGNYLVDDSAEKFPYQRFEVALDSSIQGTDSVEITWKGKSLDGRKVTLYAWSPSKLAWSPLKTVIAGSEDFQLQAHVTAGEYANNHKIQVMVQDEIAARQNQTASSDPAAYDFSFVWMSDTQYYSKSYPYIYQDIVKWIADHKEDNKIKYVIHTGDIVDNADQEYQWVEADKDMKVLEDAKIPYGVLAGNHDVGHQNNDYSYYDKWFGEDRFKNQPTYGESYDNNRGHYDLVSSNGNDFIVVYMGWGYGDKEIDWINEVLKKYPNRKAILNFHEFMLVSNNRAPMAEKVFERVIKPNKNVIAALSGHYHDAELKIDSIDDDGDGVADRNVYQMLADYQGAPEGGLGYIRLMQFDMAHGKINMKTYSPYLNDYNYYDPAEYPGKDEFSLDLNLASVTKRVATDYFGVNVYTANVIGSVDHVKSGDQASVVWRDLAPSTSYQWYAVAQDAYGGRKQSDIWRFTTGVGKSNPEPTPDSGSSTPSTPSEDKVTSTDGTLTLPTGKKGEVSLDNDVTVSIPADASAKELKITIEKLRETQKLITKQEVLASPIYEILKNVSENFSKPVTLSFKFDPKMVKSTQRPAVFYYDEAALKWIEVGGKVEGDRIVVEVNHFTKYAVMVVGPTVVEPTKPGLTLSDIAGHWAEANIKQAVSSGIVSGYPEGTFEPNHTVTRAEFAVMLMNTLKPQGNGAALTFADAASIGAWAQQAVAQAVQAGIIHGYEDGTFRPNAPITRAEMAAMLAQAVRQSADANAASGFADDKDIPAWATSAVVSMKKLGILEGKGANEFAPNDQTTRAEAVTVLLKVLALK
ncbi:S-layer homology domain-containing protein [Paenibacillus sp. HWE-109]|uniref:S-layer homology domain-containing protein n=1 Tax=Paenibacillus sp. HWE-109 TaxID=1306526 RepID=UPI001EDF361D|nr:S-layer homology domain-containing protein [Paenibacillus sp. HWE-109]UKS26587.1 S-layer homology domain-containing protein [Paenibacillus sp. HWE-109]